MTGPRLEEAARPATPDDLPALVALEARARAGVADARGGPLHLATEPELAAALRDHLADPDHLVLVGTLDEVPVGVLVARARDLGPAGRVARVDLLHVDPEARGVGVGAALLDAALGWADRVGCAGIEAVALPGDRGTKNFFESYGMVAHAIRVYRGLGGDG